MLGREEEEGVVSEVDVCMYSLLLFVFLPRIPHYKRLTRHHNRRATEVGMQQRRLEAGN